MSRIDEALRQLSDEKGKSHASDATSESEWSFQPYQREKEAPKRAERPSPVQAERVTAAFPQPVATAKPKGKAAGVQGKDDGKLVTGSSTSPVLVEQYRRLAAVLDQAHAEKQIKTIAITSSLPREGKTLTAANLALTLSESYGRRVLLIDADLRRPSLHTALGVANGRGLGEVLRSPQRDCAFVQVTELLSLLPGGRADRNPLSALSSERMKELLEAAEAEYDWVILDTPPVGVLSDAQIVGRLAGGVLFVIAAGQTPLNVVERAIAEIGPECILGTVLNRVDEGQIPESVYNDYLDINN